MTTAIRFPLIMKGSPESVRGLERKRVRGCDAAKWAGSQGAMGPIGGDGCRGNHGCRQQGDWDKFGSNHIETHCCEVRTGRVV